MIEESNKNTNNEYSHWIPKKIISMNYILGFGMYEGNRIDWMVDNKPHWLRHAHREKIIVLNDFILNLVEKKIQELSNVGRVRIGRRARKGNFHE